ncbi:MAG: uracil-DNA glycosylase [Clostridiales bacterium GWB2_37_7]|nr:MAG: uracil-DNA glycosylase [Clostridiales bacterium GWB2_37_7]
MKVENINCIKCKNYMITWDSRFPKGCRIFGFKGSQMPSITVFQATGAPCKNFQEKQPRDGKV